MTAAVLARLAARQFVASRDAPDERDPFGRAALETVAYDAARAADAEQAAACETLWRSPAPAASRWRCCTA